LNEERMIRLSTNAGHVSLTLLSPSRKKDGPDVETVYEVEIVPSPRAWTVLHSDSSWSCTCKAYQFGAGKPCKHITSVSELSDILDAFARSG
jgi:hypothetical protein